jgi:hypothetical protein
MQTMEDLEELTELACGTTAIYLRYSLGPDQDAATVSRDYEADVDLPGLPCTLLTPERWWPREPEDWIARRVCKYLHLAAGDQRRRPWILTGDVAGYGPDQEPLLTSVHPLAWLSGDLVGEARRRYHQRFDVGQTSLT